VILPGHFFANRSSFYRSKTSAALYNFFQFGGGAAFSFLLFVIEKRIVFARSKDYIKVFQLGTWRHSAKFFGLILPIGSSFLLLFRIILPYLSVALFETIATTYLA